MEQNSVKTLLIYGTHAIYRQTERAVWRMRIWAADDEKLALEMMVQAISEACPDAEIESFTRPGQLLETAQHEQCDVAFLDIRMRGMDGVELAGKLKELNPSINVIFVTGYDEYTHVAMKMHASGYIMKPVTCEKVRQEMEDLRYPIEQHSGSALLRIKCFGNFEVFGTNGQPLHFYRSKSKETLAYLVHRYGASCTIREIAGILFEDLPFEARQQHYMQQIISSMMRTLSEAGASSAVFKRYNSLALNVEMVECDYYDFMRAEPCNTAGYNGEYMSQYSWAEYMTAYLEQH